MTTYRNCGMHSQCAQCWRDFCDIVSSEQRWRRLARFHLGLAVVLAFLLFIVARRARADDARAWSTLDVVLESTCAAATAVDWLQTSYGARHPEIEETNPLLGRHPSPARVNLYFPAVLVGHLAVSSALPGRWRTLWQGVTLGIEADAINRNRIFHIGFALPWGR